MRTVTLTLKAEPPVPAEAEQLIPDVVAGKTAEEVRRLPLLVGNRRETVGDWFDVVVDEAEAAAPDLLLRGDLVRFKRLGEGMSRGAMVVEGRVGFHAGARMSGGSLTIAGDAGDFLGAHMAGGRLVVHGDAGHYVAAAYRGEKTGMKGGTIVVTGSVGQMVGARMRRGLVYVQGDAGDVAGYNMKGGTVVVGGAPAARVGARMVRGTVAVLGGEPLELLPTFSYACTYAPTFWRVVHRELARVGHAPRVGPGVTFRRYCGDVNEGGRGEVLAAQPG